MATSQRLAEWLLDNSALLDLKVTALTWPQDWNVANLHDIELSISIQGKVFLGRGTAATQEDALSKAAGEAMERAYTAGNTVHSTGVALHTSKERAQSGARQELIERSSFFAHFYGNKPFLKLEDSELSDLTNRYKPLLQNFNEAGIKVSFCRPVVLSEVPVVLCVAEGMAASAPWGGAIGLAAKNNAVEAATSALFECARGAAANLLKGPRSVTLQQFCNLPQPGSFDRQRLATNLEYWRSISHLFSSGGETGEHEKRPFPSISLRQLPCPFKEISHAPVFAYRAAPPGDVDIHNSDPKQNPALLNWLSEFSGWSFRAETLPEQPHFLG